MKTMKEWEHDSPLVGDAVFDTTTGQIVGSTI
jgi:hypothetical protein